MARMKRKDVLSAIRVAGYHGNMELGRYLYLKNWVSLSTYGREFAAGAAMRQSGIPCDCTDCRKRIAGIIDRTGSRAFTATAP